MHSVVASALGSEADSTKANKPLICKCLKNVATLCFSIVSIVTACSDAVLGVQQLMRAVAAQWVHPPGLSMFWERRLYRSSCAAGCRQLQVRSCTISSQ